MNKTFILAEVGVNHNGSIELAKQLIDKGVEAGVDAIKFQTFKAENLVTKSAPQAEYQKENTGKTESQYEMLKRLEFSFEEFKILKEYCEEKGCMFLSTPFDIESVDMLEDLGVSMYKIGSGDLTNLPILKYMANKNKPIILSTGMASLGEIEEAINAIVEEGNDQLTLLHCTSSYPTKFEDVNLNAMLTLKNAFKFPVGYSDHTIGLEVPIAAVAMGATVIEKHYTLDKNMEGPDHKASLNPDELKLMVTNIRNIEKSFGSGIKKCGESESNTKKVARKSIVANVDIKAGEEITWDKVTLKRPETGIAPKYIKDIIGQVATIDINKDTPLQWSMITR